MNKNDYKNWIKDPSKHLIMGIINTTPDSFSDGGMLNSVSKEIDYAYKLLSQGADIIDIGGESTRPGSQKITSTEEIQRISPLIKELSNNCDCAISVDTYKSPTVKFALDNGVDIINDISGLTFDPSMANLIAKYDASLEQKSIREQVEPFRANIQAQYALAVMYDNGEGTEVNHEAAFKYYKLAAQGAYSIISLLVSTVYLKI